MLEFVQYAGEHFSVTERHNHDMHDQADYVYFQPRKTPVCVCYYNLIRPYQ